MSRVTGIYVPRPQRLDLKVGDRVEAIPYLGMECDNTRRHGTVVYIHPERRFYTVRFDEGYLQSFQWGWEK